MKEYRRSIPWMDDDASGFGDSYGNYETQSDCRKLRSIILPYMVPLS